MTSLPPHRAERERICDLFLEVGPDAPTLDEGWATADLAAHLYVRERHPLAATGIMLRPLGALHDKGIADVKRQHPYDEVVATIRSGPPMPFRLLDGLVNLQEYFVHHEDVRRGAGDTTPRPEDAVADVEAALWQGLTRTHRMMTMRCHGLGVDLVRADGVTIRSGGGAERVRIVGRPGEIVLYLLGRRDAAHVELEGTDRAKARLADASLGI